MQLVPASQFTIEELTAAYNQTRVDYIVPMPMTAQRLRQYVNTYDISLDASAVAIDGDDILGLCMLGIREQRAWITRLGVLPVKRRHGAGQALMEYEIEQAVRYGLSTIYLEVIVGNAPAYALFSRLGFVEERHLLILRRPPGSPPEAPLSPVEATWVEPEETLNYLSSRPWRAAWTNQAESIANAGDVRALHLVELDSGNAGWVTYQQTALQFKRVMLAPSPGSELAPAFSLLHHLHSSGPLLDTIAENVPAEAPHLADFYALGYVESFARIEMLLQLNS